MSKFPGVYTTGEAARLCRVSQQTIIRCFDNGQLKGFRVPGSRFRRITQAGLVEFMAANNIPTDLLLATLTEAERAQLGTVAGPVKVAAPVNRIAGLVPEAA
ncbi:MAG TPA: helix-turn-helix domain-containing protein [Gemmata sp.]